MVRDDEERARVDGSPFHPSSLVDSGLARLWDIMVQRTLVFNSLFCLQISDTSSLLHRWSHHQTI